MKAFPALRTEQYQDVDGNWREKADDGMDLRDYFAAKAMQAMLSWENIDEFYVSKEAYMMADAMMKARETNE